MCMFFISFSFKYWLNLHSDTSLSVGGKVAFMHMYVCLSNIYFGCLGTAQRAVYLSGFLDINLDAGTVCLEVR